MLLVIASLTRIALCQAPTIIGIARVGNVPLVVVALPTNHHFVFSDQIVGNWGIVALLPHGTTFQVGYRLKQSDDLTPLSPATPGNHVVFSFSSGPAKVRSVGDPKEIFLEFYDEQQAWATTIKFTYGIIDHNRRRRGRNCDRITIFVVELVSCELGCTYNGCGGPRWAQFVSDLLRPTDETTGWTLNPSITLSI
jgi:hypothetical protein